MLLAKRITTGITIVSFFLFILSACVSEEEYNSNYIYYWQGSQYTLYDPFGSHIESQWQFPINNRSDTTKVKVFFGPENDLGKKPNKTVKKFNDPALDMLLIDWGDLLCKDNYLPNYHAVKEVEDIFLVKRSANYGVDYFGSNAISIRDKEKVDAIYKNLVYASETKDWYKNSSPEQEEQYVDGEIHIGLKFYGVVAIYDAGYINKTESGTWGLYLYDLQPYELYLLNDRTIQLLHPDL